MHNDNHDMQQSPGGKHHQRRQGRRRVQQLGIQHGVLCGSKAVGYAAPPFVELRSVMVSTMLKF